MHKWRARYAADGARGAEDRARRRGGCPHRRGPAARGGHRRVARAACPGRRSRGASGCPARPWARAAALGLGRLRPSTRRRPWCATSASIPGSSCMWTRRPWAASRAPGTACTGDRRHRSPRIGWDHVHVAIDDASRVAYVEVLRTLQTGATPSASSSAPSRGTAATAIAVERVMTDNGSAYRLQGLQPLSCAARPAPSPHAPLHAAHQRKSRALHPDPVARMGLPPALRTSRAPPVRSAVAALLQPPPATHELELSRSYDSASAGPAMNNLPGFDT